MIERMATNLPRKRKQAPHKDLCSAAEAIEILGIPQATFYGLVTSEIIHRVTPEGMKEGYYVRDEILNYKRNLAALSEPYRSSRIDFGLALTEDIPSIYQLTASVSGGTDHAVPKDTLKAWIRREPQSIHILRKGTEILGYVSMFSLEHDTLMDRLSGKLLNRNMPVDDIVRFTPGSEISLYVAEMAVKHSPGYLRNNEPIQEKQDPDAAFLGERLLLGMRSFIASLEEQDISIKRLYAVGTSYFGIKMCRKLHMNAMNLPEGTNEKRIPFELEIANNRGSKLIRRLRAS